MIRHGGALDGDTDKYMRFGDTYIKHDDGALDVVRDGANEPHSYAPAAWTNVQGDEKQLKRSRFQGWFTRGAPASPPT